MRISAGLIALILVLSVGCQRKELASRTTQDQTLFGATAMRVHPIFSSIKDWTNDGQPDGIEALVEFQDRFADPTKAAGKVVFELFDYRTGHPDPRGGRVSEPWVGRIVSLDEQQARWNRTSRTYSFQLSNPRLDPSRDYVLTLMFELSGGGRFFDRIILPGTKPAREKRDPNPIPFGTSNTPVTQTPPISIPTNAPTAAPPVDSVLQPATTQQESDRVTPSTSPTHQPLGRPAQP